MDKISINALKTSYSQFIPIRKPKRIETSLNTGEKRRDESPEKGSRIETSSGHTRKGAWN